MYADQEDMVSLMDPDFCELVGSIISPRTSRHKQDFIRKKWSRGTCAKIEKTEVNAHKRRCFATGAGEARSVIWLACRGCARGI